MVESVATTPMCVVLAPISAASGAGSCFGTDRVLEIVFRAAAVSFRDHQCVFEHDVVEAGALHRLGHIDEELAVPGSPSRRGKRVKPLVGSKVREPGEMKFAVGHYGLRQKGALEGSGEETHGHW